MTGEFASHRPLLFGIAYRMLGCVADANDMVQETWLRWQRQDGADVQSPKAWLVATLTRLCIDELRAARRTRADYYGVWLPEPLVEWTSASPRESATQADSLSMAFMLMLEALSPAERAVFLLREVFDYDYAEIAPIVGKTEANCRQLARRAKEALAQRPPADESAPTARATEVVRRFLAAAATGELADLLALLTDDAVLYTDGGGRVAAAGRPIAGADRVGRFFVGIRARAPAEQQLHFALVNGCPGAVVTTGGRVERTWAFALAGERVQGIYMVRNPEKLRHVSAPTPASLSA